MGDQRGTNKDKKKPRKDKSRYFAETPTKGDEETGTSVVEIQPSINPNVIRQNAKKYSHLSLKNKTDGFKRERLDAKFGKERPKYRHFGRDRGLYEERNVKKNAEKNDPFPGDAEIPKGKIKKYNRGQIKDVKTKHALKSASLRNEKKKIEAAARDAARSEMMLHETVGTIVADEGEKTTDVTQFDLKESVDITSAQKSFDLDLRQFGPYKINYTRNGRFLVIAGQKGHVACMDWITKKLMCEMNVMETTNDVKWLHQETMFAVAQKRWTYIYDNQGIELHCLKMLDCALRLEFLPHHFLLASASAKGFLSYIDTSIGKQVAGHSTRCGRLDVMAQNPSNGIICLGHPGGKLTMWSPNVKQPLVKMLVHGSSTRSIAVDNTGKYMATSGVDRTVKIWDLRTYKMVEGFKVGAGAGSLSFSQQNFLAAGMGNIVEVYKDCGRSSKALPYINHRFQSTVSSVQFCPYEDVLGAGHGDGFTSLLVPGAGEPNFDALEANPYQTKSQRRQAEVQMLLDKIQPEMIQLEAERINQVDVLSTKEQQDSTNRALLFRPEKIDFTPKHKKKGRSKIGNIQKRKTAVFETNLRRDIVKIKQRDKDSQSTRKNIPASVLDRFVKKDS